MNQNLTKTRIRDNEEFFTPDLIVENMLNLVKQETERINSSFLESACGDGIFSKHSIISFKKISQVAWKKAYSFVPMQDFSKPWNEEELYKNII